MIIRVSIGGVETGGSEDQLFTVVGSCVAIMLYDMEEKIGGMAHIMLGYSNGSTDSPGKYADTAVPYMIRMMERKGAFAHRLLGAKIAGGGEMFATISDDYNVSKKNLKAVREVLAHHGIRVIAEDCGGNTGKRVTFDVATGKVLVESQGSSKAF